MTFGSLVSPEAPRHRTKRGVPHAGVGFSAFIKIEQEAVDQDLEETTRDSKRIKDQRSAIDSDFEPLNLSLGRSANEVHTNVLKAGSIDGSITRRAVASAKNVGGFTERLVQLNYMSVLIDQAKDGRQSNNEPTDSSNEDETQSSSSFALPSITRPRKQCPEKSIMKKSRFGAPNIYPSGERPIAEFWNESDNKYQAARVWIKEMESFNLQPVEDSSRLVRFHERPVIISGSTGIPTESCANRILTLNLD